MKSERPQRTELIDDRGPLVRIHLNIIEGEGHGTQFDVTQSRSIIGRASCEIVIPDRKVSTRHAALEVKGREVVLTDLGSTNGTYVNNQRVTSVTLSNLDEITLGTTRLAISIFEDLNRFKQDRKASRGEPESAHDLLKRNDSVVSQVTGSGLSETQRVSTSQSESQSYLRIEQMILEEIKDIPIPGTSARRRSQIGKESPDGRASLQNFSCVLRLIRGPDSPRDFTLKDARTVLGRKNCAIKLNDIDISRQHAAFEVVTPDKVYVRDLGSTNGTFVNGKRVSYQILKNKDIVQVGQTLVEVHIDLLKPNS